MRVVLTACHLLLLASLAAEKPTIHYKPPPGEDEDDRPVATEISVAPQGSDIGLRVEFNRAPWGEACKARCANATIFLDTDDNPTTGLQLGKGTPETGADIAVTIQGAREIQEGSAAVVLRVKAKQLPNGSTSVDSGDAFAEMDLRRDPERVQSDGNTVYVLVDATNATLPSGKSMRVVYHPPGAKPLVGKTKGLLAGGSGKIQIFKKGKEQGEKRRSGQ
jgi:hypothetical protein